MRGLLVACSLVLSFLVGATAFAQSAERLKRSAASSPSPDGKSQAEVREINERVAAWLKTCLTDWDQATHMTRQEWQTTCQRVAAERGKFLREDPGAMAIGTKRQPPR